MPKETAGDKELQEALQRIHEIESSLEEKMEAVYERSGLPRETIKNYLENTDKLTADQKAEIENRLHALREKLGVTAQPTPQKQKKKKKKEKEGKKRRGKTLGARKRWIPM